MELIQIVLPLYDNAGNRLPRSLFAQTLEELTARFGGVTAFTRAPAEGLWEDGTGRVIRDDVVVVEVMAEEAGEGWWADYTKALEERYRQQTVVVRALPCRLL